ncbi:MAG TPA: hypothetical protein VL241_06970, partial [Gemmatimonadales bacterium]|nr:hypothetical protein [Gemmatimonadales bacterium]
TAPVLAASLGVGVDEVTAALHALEAEGVILRGHFTPGGSELEWCERRLLARIHRYTLNRLRAEIAPVSGAEFLRYLFGWQHLATGQRKAGLEGLAAVIEQLDGYEVPAGAWESEVLSARCEEYDPALLDLLCLTGRVSWGRLSPVAAQPGNGGHGNRPIRTSPVALFLREHAALWQQLAAPRAVERLSGYALAVRDALRGRGASFLPELVSSSGLLASQVEQALGELAALGLVTSDSFAGLRALLTPSAKRPPLGGGVRRQRTVPFGMSTAGRWSLIGAQASGPGSEEAGAGTIEQYARVLLRRYGVVFHRLLARESLRMPWRELLLVYRRLEARGELRGGRFVAGVTGEQFALPEAVVSLRAARREAATGGLLSISAADPLNLIGVVTPGERVPALTANRIVFEDGLPLAVLESGAVRWLEEQSPERAREVTAILQRRPMSPRLRAVLGMSGRHPPEPSARRRKERV